MHFCQQLFLLAFLLAGFSQAQAQSQSLNKAARDAIRFACANAKIEIESAAKGDLNGDGIDDVAIVVKCPADWSQKIIVLFGDANGTFRIAEESLTWLGHDRRADSVFIKSGSLTYEQSCAAACNSPWTAIFKFKIQDDLLVLVGEDHESFGDAYTSPKDGLLAYGYSYKQSINYLSKEVMYSRKTNKKRLEKRFNFSQNLVKFSAYSQDVDTRTARELTAFIDENFKLKFLSK